MIFDTDVLIFAQRGSVKAARTIDDAKERFISVQSLMELMQGAKDKTELRVIRKFLFELEFTVLPLSEDIGHRALVYVEEYGLAASMRAGDAIIAATAVEFGKPLSTSNVKHFKVIKELDLRPFRP
ncbi:MAG: type II toxin-antitoxin system VapC family toxin [Deltaproteobacteria bacterium]|nr:type II toxin-antitoxin system VapC family toxin [Deltaproteobacteria bacterium]